MASTINASNSGFGGIVSTGDSSGQLQLQTAGTTAVTIDTSQNATFAKNIVLNGSTSGSVTLAAPAVAGTTTLTLPTTTGTLVTSNAMPTGSVLQVVQTVKTDVFTTTSTSFVDVTGLSVSITPTSSSNKILVFTDVALGTSNGSGTVAKLLRNSTDIYVGDAAGSRPRGIASVDGQYTTFRCGIQFLDSPATTSATTYKIQIFSTTGSTSAVNRTGADRDTSLYDARVASSVTVMEIKA